MAMLYCVSLFSFLLAGSVAGESAGVDCDAYPDSIVPQGVHLAYAGDVSTQMFVSFFTCSHPGDRTPSVQLWEDRVTLNFEGDTLENYKRFYHHVKLSGLKPGTRYDYSVGFSNGGIRHGNFSFQTCKAELTKFTALVVGDMGVNNTQKTIDRLSERVSSSNLTIHLGDVSYADDYSTLFNIRTSSGRSYNAVFDHFLRITEPVAAWAPYMVMAGNHDVSAHILKPWGPKELGNFSALRYRYRIPHMWYSFRLGPVHFAVVNTESDFYRSPTSPNKWFPLGGRGGGFGNQLQWLNDDLESASADPTVSFIVVMGHRHWYSTDEGIEWPFFSKHYVQKAFEPILHKFGVDLYLCGHAHLYERTKPAYENKVDLIRGIPQIISGAAGCNEGIDKGRGKDSLIDAFNYDTEGYGVLELDGDTLSWRYFSSVTNQILDELHLKPKARSWLPGKFPNDVLQQ